MYVYELSGLKGFMDKKDNQLSCKDWTIDIFFMKKLCFLKKDENKISAGQATR